MFADADAVALLLYQAILSPLPEGTSVAFDTVKSNNVAMQFMKSIGCSISHYVVKLQIRPVKDIPVYKIYSLTNPGSVLC